MDSNKSRGNAKNEITLIFATFGADLINTSKVQVTCTSLKQSDPGFLRHPV